MKSMDAMIQKDSLLFHCVLFTCSRMVLVQPFSAWHDFSISSVRLNKLWNLIPRN